MFYNIGAAALGVSDKLQSPKQASQLQAKNPTNIGRWQEQLQPWQDKKRKLHSNVF